MPIMFECPNCTSEFGAIAEARQGRNPWPDQISAMLKCGSCKAQFRFQYEDDGSEQADEPVMYMTKDEEDGEQRFPQGQYEWYQI